MTFFFYTNSNSMNPRLILLPAQEGSEDSSSSLFSNFFSVIFDQVFEQDRFQEALQNSLQTYHNELFQKKDEFKLILKPILLQSSDLSRLTESHCLICLESFQLLDSVYDLKCSHMFHESCLNDSISYQHNTCPLCRESLELCPKWEQFMNENGHQIRFNIN